MLLLEKILHTPHTSAECGLLGGTVGPGTLVFAFGVGPPVEVGFWLTKKLAIIVGPSPVTARLPGEYALVSDPEPLHPVSHPVDQPLL